PVVAIDSQRERLILRRRPTRVVGPIGIRVDVKHIERARAVNLIAPIDLIQKPGELVDVAVRALVAAVGAVPVEPPAAAYRSQANGGRIPALEVARFGAEGVAQLLVAGGTRVDIMVSAAPDVHFVVHVVEVQRRGRGVEGGGQCGGPGVAVKTAATAADGARART